MTTKDKAKSLIKEQGTLKFSWLALRYILRRTIGLDWWKEILLERSLAEPIKEVVPKIQVLIRQGTENDLDKFKGIVSKKDYKRFQQRFQKGRICFVALDGEKVAAYSWISFNEFDTNKRKEMKLSEKEAYLFDIFVVPEYRNNRLQTALDTVRLNYAKSQGFAIAVTLIIATNTYSLKSANTSGFKPVNSLTACSIFWSTFELWPKTTTKISIR
jgi:hypothetical protein